MRLDEHPPLSFHYVNHRGEAAHRSVRPLSVWYGRSDYYEGEGWFLRAFDLDRGAERDFMLSRMSAIGAEILAGESGDEGGGA